MIIQILVKNNEKTIEKCLESIVVLKSKITIIDTGCTDSTIQLCKKFNNIEIINYNEENRSKIRNEVSSNINFYLEPWEFVVTGHEEILKTKEICAVQVFNNDIITKENRIWSKEKFKNPIFETIDSNEFNYNPKIIISSKNAKDDRQDKLSATENWLQQHPTLNDVYYYMSCCHLSLRNYEKFIVYANQYLFREQKITTSYIMTKYYLSQVYLHKNKIKESAENALTCVSCCPFMSEFWCLLGDIYYKQKQFKKSKNLYENAIIIGKKRKFIDEFPMEIKKYKEYPQKMIENIKKIILDTKIY